MASTQSATTSAPESDSHIEGTKEASVGKDTSSSYAGMASSAAGSAAESATNAAVGVKDTMFSMFGGGAKKEVRDETKDQEEDRSGSAKALKEKEKEKEKETEDKAEGARGAGDDEDGVRSTLVLSAWISCTRFC